MGFQYAAYFRNLWRGPLRSNWAMNLGQTLKWSRWKRFDKFLGMIGRPSKRIPTTAIKTALGCFETTKHTHNPISLVRSHGARLELCIVVNSDQFWRKFFQHCLTIPFKFLVSVQFERRIELNWYLILSRELRNAPPAMYTETLLARSGGTYCRWIHNDALHILVNM